uniref:histidine kinase n=1 Tax=Oscillatoriales cyanobacterium SpSt-418 TaxID=2282169 RepID=A0A7C3KJB4_9CYAN
MSLRNPTPLGVGGCQKDGTIRWLSSSYTSRKVSEDSWIVTAINYDITERKQAEEALQESEQLYHQILDSIADIVVVKQPDSRLLWGNKAFREYYGMTLEELQGLIDAPFNAPDYTRQYIHDDAFVFSTGQTLTISEELVTRHDGVVRTFNTIKAPIYDEAGQVVLLVAVCRDISDRKQLELSLQASEAQLSQILNQVTAAIIQFRVFSNHDYEYDYFSTGCEVLYGYTAQELMADKMLWMSRVFPDDQTTIVLPVLDAFMAGASPTIEYRFYHKDGSIRWISSAYTSQQIEPGCWQVTGVSQDITDRKLAEQKIREQAALLDITSDAILVRDLNHRILYWNQGAEQLYGWPVSAAMGQLTYELLHENVAQVTEMTQRLLQQGEWRGEIRQVTKTGKEVIVEARWTLVRNEAGQPKFILSVNTDVTEKKQLESQLHRAQRLESMGTLASGIAHDLNN